MENLEKGKQLHTVQFTRVFDAPRELVWNAWTNPETFKKWWGPSHYTCPEAKIDLRPGGKYLFAMKPQDGKVVWGGGTYTEVTKPSRIVCTDSFMDEKGNIVSPTEYGMTADFPRELYITLTFEEQDGKTKLTLVHKAFPTEQVATDCNTGWSESFDKLDRLLMQQIV
jgi:uncharacterized protein YndB with AHSA1/START domain